MSLSLWEPSKKVVKETLKTERNYACNIRGLLELYFQPLRDAAYVNPIIDMGKIVKIFANMEDILIINEELCCMLEQRERTPCDTLPSSRESTMRVTMTLS